MRAIFLLLCVCLYGCGLFPNAADRALRKNPSFRAGYDDGCAAASTLGANPREAPYRDEESYRNDQGYRMGWGNGFATCRNEIAGSPAGNPSVNPLPGQP